MNLLLASKLWDGGCGIDEENLITFEKITMSLCKSLCDVKSNCGYFEYEEATTDCRLFKNSSNAVRDESQSKVCYKGHLPCTSEYF